MVSRSSEDLDCIESQALSIRPVVLHERYSESLEIPGLSRETTDLRLVLNRVSGHSRSLREVVPCIIVRSIQSPCGAETCGNAPICISGTVVPFRIVCRVTRSE